MRNSCQWTPGRVRWHSYPQITLCGAAGGRRGRRGGMKSSGGGPCVPLIEAARALLKPVALAARSSLDLLRLALLFSGTWVTPSVNFYQIPSLLFPPPFVLCPEVFKTPTGSQGQRARGERRSTVTWSLYTSPQTAVVLMILKLLSRFYCVTLKLFSLFSTQSFKFIVAAYQLTFSPSFRFFFTFSFPYILT